MLRENATVTSNVSDPLMPLWFSGKRSERNARLSAGNGEGVDVRVGVGEPLPVAVTVAVALPLGEVLPVDEGVIDDDDVPDALEDDDGVTDGVTDDDGDTDGVPDIDGVFEGVTDGVGVADGDGAMHTRPEHRPVTQSVPLRHCLPTAHGGQ
jgi:hypothetical protein